MSEYLDSIGMGWLNDLVVDPLMGVDIEDQPRGADPSGYRYYFPSPDVDPAVQEYFDVAKEIVSRQRPGLPANVVEGMAQYFTGLPYPKVIEDFGDTKQLAEDFLVNLGQSAPDGYAGQRQQRPLESIKTQDEYNLANLPGYTTGQNIQSQDVVNYLFPPDEFVLNDMGQTYFQRQSDLETLQALQDGKTAPPYASPRVMDAATALLLAPAGLLGAGGAAIDGKNLSGIASEANEAIGGAVRQINNRGGFFGDRTALGRLKNALYWNKRSSGADRTRERGSGANFPSRSLANLMGVGQYFADRGNLLTRAVDPLRQRIMDFNYYQDPNQTTPEFFQNLGENDARLRRANEIRRNIQKDSPVIQNEAQRAFAPQIESNFIEQDRYNYQDPNASLGSLQYGINDALEAFGLPKALPDAPMFLTPALNTGVNVLFETVSDPSIALGPGVKALTSLATGGPRAAGKSLVRSLKSFPTDYRQELAIEGPLEMADMGYERMDNDIDDFFFKPEPPSGFRQEDRASYLEDYDAFQARRKELEKELEEYYNTEEGRAFAPTRTPYPQNLLRGDFPNVRRR